MLDLLKNIFAELGDISLGAILPHLEGIEDKINALKSPEAVMGFSLEWIANFKAATGRYNPEPEPIPTAEEGEV